MNNHEATTASGLLPTRLLPRSDLEVHERTRVEGRTVPESAHLAGRIVLQHHASLARHGLACDRGTWHRHPEASDALVASPLREGALRIEDVRATDVGEDGSYNDHHQVQRKAAAEEVPDLQAPRQVLRLRQNHHIGGRGRRQHKPKRAADRRGQHKGERVVDRGQGCGVQRRKQCRRSADGREQLCCDGRHQDDQQVQREGVDRLGDLGKPVADGDVEPRLRETLGDGETPADEEEEAEVELVVHRGPCEERLSGTNGRRDKEEQHRGQDSQRGVRDQRLAIRRCHHLGDLGAQQEQHKLEGLNQADEELVPREVPDLLHQIVVLLCQNIPRQRPQLQPPAVPNVQHHVRHEECRRRCRECEEPPSGV
mmetsp:Transcript_101331/g.284070  ORF Transcript_101331/g.284070 Transcript_101331/m.284070 type:complete len:369 (+) Transcript_101331:3-1109(+)